MSFYRSKIAPSLVITLGLFAGISLGDEPLPSNIRVILPGKLATQIAQDAIGVPSGHGDSTVTIRVKKPITPRIRRLNLSKTAGIFKFYAAKLFGINLETPFQLDLRIPGLVVKGDVKVTQIRFSEPPREGSRVFADVDLELRRLSVSAGEIFAREHGLSPPNVSGKRCPVPKTPISQYTEGRVGASVQGAKVTPKSGIEAEIPVHAHGRFEAVYENKKLVLTPVSVTHDVSSVMQKNYQLNAHITTPPVFFILDGECFQGNPRGVDTFFQSLLEDIKKEIILAVGGKMGDITQVALEESAAAFSELDIPVEKTLQGKKEHASVEPTAERHSLSLLNLREPLQPSQITMERDHTYVAPVILNSAPSTDRCGDFTPQKKSSKPSPMDEILWNFQETLSLGSIGADPSGALQLELGDRLILNQKNETRVAPSDEGIFPAQGAKNLRIVLNKSFFQSKMDLVSSLKEEQSRLFPAGVRLGKKGIEVRGRKDGGLSVIAHAEVQLKSLKGIAGVAGSLVEKVAGNTDGIYRVPLQLNLTPSILDVPTEGCGRRLVLQLSLNRNLLENEFGQKSNLGDAAGLLVKLISNKLGEFADKMEKKPIRIDLRPLEEKAPVRVERIVFSDQGSLAVDLQVNKFKLPEKKKPAVNP